MLSGMAANKQKEVSFEGSILVAAHNAVKKSLTETGSSKQSIASMKTQFNITNNTLIKICSLDLL